MDIDRSNRFGPLSEHRLSDFENAIGFTFPEDFRAFLLAHNGGRPKKNVVFLPEKKEAFDSLHHTFGLHDGPEYFRLDRAHRIHEPFLPKTLVPFADDPGGNAYCIDVSNEGKGKIYFWDHDQGLRYEPMLLAESFTAFLCMLGNRDES